MLYPKQDLILLDTEYGFNVIYKVFKIKKIIDKNKFYIINSHGLRTGLLAALINLLYGEQFLHTNHGLRFTQKKGLKKVYFFLIEIFILMLSSEYICVRNSDYFLMKRFLPRKIFDKKVKIIKLFLDIKNNISELDIESKFRSPFKIYAIGSLIAVKNPNMF